MSEDKEKRKGSGYQLSTREKFLIILLAVVVVVVACVMFLYLPVLERIGIAREQLETSQSLYDDMKAKADAADDLKRESDEKMILLHERAEGLMTFEDTEISKREFTRLMLDNNIVPRSASFSTGSGNSSILAFGDIKESRAEYGTIPETELLMLELSVSAMGSTLAPILGLIDHLNGTYSYIVDSVSIGMPMYGLGDYTVSYALTILYKNFE